MSKISDKQLRDYMTGSSYNFDEKNFELNLLEIENLINSFGDKSLYNNYINNTVVSKNDALLVNTSGLRRVIDKMTEKSMEGKKINGDFKDKIIAEAIQVGDGIDADTQFGYKELINNMASVLERYDISSDNNKGDTRQDDTIYQFIQGSFSDFDYLCDSESVDPKTSISSIRNPQTIKN